MSDLKSSHQDAISHPHLTFARIVCGVDGSRRAREASAQAIAIAEPGAALMFVCVRSSAGVGATYQSSIGATRAADALHAAVRESKQLGIEAHGKLIQGDDAAEGLFAEARDADLLVVGSHGGSRAGGITLGSTASTTIHRALVPVLVARRLPGGVGLGERVVVAVDGSEQARRGLELGARIAIAQRAPMVVVSVDDGEAGQVAEDALRLATAIGADAIAVRASGDPADELVQLAARESASLMVVGSRGLSGVKALGSVSERVAHRVRCSVLVVRPART